MAETADLLADLVSRGVRTLAFVSPAEAPRRSPDRPGSPGRGLIRPAGPGRRLPGRYLPEDRRELEKDCASGELLGLATTNALELGHRRFRAGRGAHGRMARHPRLPLAADRASRTSRPGRRWRCSSHATTRWTPTWSTIRGALRAAVEATVLDPYNPYVLGPHLCAAAAELPLTEDDLPLFGPTAARCWTTWSPRACSGGARPGGSGRAGARRRLADLRGAGGPPHRGREADTGRLLGTVDYPAPTTVHDRRRLRAPGRHLPGGRARPGGRRRPGRRGRPRLLHASPATSPHPRSSRPGAREPWGPAALHFGDRGGHQPGRLLPAPARQTGEILGEEPAGPAAAYARTRAVWWTVPADAAGAAGVDQPDAPGRASRGRTRLHRAAPAVATCDRWDIGGVSTALHPDTGLPTVFVYDGHPGGAGFAERGFARPRLARATRDAIASCECDSGCPSCVQSPKCGNGNEPLDKQGALHLLATLLPTP